MTAPQNQRLKRESATRRAVRPCRPVPTNCALADKASTETLGRACPMSNEKKKRAAYSLLPIPYALPLHAALLTTSPSQHPLSPLNANHPPGYLFRLKHPVGHAISRHRIQKWPLLRRLIAQQVLDIAEHRHAVAVITMTDQAAICR